ncbi:hypothetical protein N474_06905 [Pseudoalteromonas luteoviolacea CPMOR-2]|nr:hypothetical protein N474_06905 [Pseudoalteromonas luteoviolacea CPMOR-2]
MGVDSSNAIITFRKTKNPAQGWVFANSET